MSVPLRQAYDAPTRTRSCEPLDTHDSQVTPGSVDHLEIRSACAMANSPDGLTIAIAGVAAQTEGGSVGFLNSQGIPWIGRAERLRDTVRTCHRL